MPEKIFDNDPIKILEKIPNHFPFENLGELQAPVNAVSQIHKVPVEMPAQSALSVTALSSQKHIVIRGLVDQVYPTSQYHITIAESGDRKSTVDRQFMKEVEKYEIEIEEAAKKLNQIDEDSRKVAENPIPSLIIGTGTWEGIFKEFINNQSLGLFNDEGGMFIGGIGMNEDNRIKMLSGLTKLFDGSTISKTTRGDETIKLRNRNLSIHLMMQPVISKVFKDPIIQYQGFLPRCLISITKANEKRYINEELLIDEVKKPIIEFNKKIAERLRKPFYENKKIVGYSKQIKNLFIDFHNSIEDRILEGKDLHELKAYAVRLVEHSLRISCNLMWYRDHTSIELSREDAENGIAISQYYLREIQRLNNYNSIDQQHKRADKLSIWCSKQDNNLFSKNTLLRCSPIRTKKELDPIINILIAHNQFIEKDGKFEFKCP